jgi:hypothetical protein
VPILLILVLILYHHAQRKNKELMEKKKQEQFSEIEKERLKIYQKLQKDYAQKEKQIDEYLEIELRNEKNSSPQPSTSMLNKRKIIANQHDNEDETDDEFFEMPLPPIPVKSLAFSTSQISIIDNEAIKNALPNDDENQSHENDDDKIDKTKALLESDF